MVKALGVSLLVLCDSACPASPSGWAAASTQPGCTELSQLGPGFGGISVCQVTRFCRADMVSPVWHVPGSLWEAMVCAQRAAGRRHSPSLSPRAKTRRSGGWQAWPEMLQEWACSALPWQTLAQSSCRILLKQCCPDGRLSTCSVLLSPVGRLPWAVSRGLSPVGRLPWAVSRGLWRGCVSGGWGPWCG